MYVNLKLWVQQLSWIFKTFLLYLSGHMKDLKNWKVKLCVGFFVFMLEGLKAFEESLMINAKGQGQGFEIGGD